MNKNKIALEIKDLEVSFDTRRGKIHAVNGVSFTLHKGEIMALVGESGCGKSVTSSSIIGLIGHKKHENVNGSIIFDGENLIDKKEKDMREIRGNRIAMIFQDPMTSLNPVIKVGKQVAEPEIIHYNKSHKEAMKNAVEMLRKVGIPAPEIRAEEYPFQFSGGMRQRAIIAMSLMCNPEVLIADEPTTALDVTMQAQILDLMLELRDSTGVGILLITHDLGVVAEICDSVAVMYAGEIVEKASVHELFHNPRHPYTKGLMGCIPKLGTSERMKPIPGQPPVLSDVPSGCSFRTRCEFADETCEKQTILTLVGENHFCTCLKGETI